MDLKKIPIPDGPWLDRLRPNHWIWLTKENRFVSVAVPWYAEPGGICGKLGIYWQGAHHVQLWYVDRYGRGVNGSQIVEPVEDNLPDDPPDLPPAQVQQILYAHSLLIERVVRLEKRVKELEDVFKIAKVLG